MNFLGLYRPQANELREQVKKFVDKASDGELELVYHLFEVTNKADWWDEITPAQQQAIDEGLKQLDIGEASLTRK